MSLNLRWWVVMKKIEPALAAEGPEAALGQTQLSLLALLYINERPATDVLLRCGLGGGYD